MTELQHFLLLLFFLYSYLRCRIAHKRWHKNTARVLSCICVWHDIYLCAMYVFVTWHRLVCICHVSVKCDNIFTFMFHWVSVCHDTMSSLRLLMHQQISKCDIILCFISSCISMWHFMFIQWFMHQNVMWHYLTLHHVSVFWYDITVPSMIHVLISSVTLSHISSCVGTERRHLSIHDSCISMQCDIISSWIYICGNNLCGYIGMWHLIVNIVMWHHIIDHM